MSEKRYYQPEMETMPVEEIKKLYADLREKYPDAEIKAATLSLSEVKCDKYDGLILPGGTAPEKLCQNSHVISIVKEFEKAKKPIAAICHGQQILISSDALRGKTATCYPGIRDDLKNSGAIYQDECVVVSQNLVTSRRPDDLPYFMREFVKLVNEDVKK